MKILVAFICLVIGTNAQRQFPEDFLFGTATASYQIEGAWNLDEKGESIWDNLTHTNPNPIKDHSNGDIAADSYHNYKRDVEMMRELGLNSYRFSLSWSRILPEGFSNRVSKPGVAFYNDYINEMLKYNIEPLVTLYHWDLPQKIQELGGWANPLIADWFADYARVAYAQFGDRVKLWITINEPREICHEGYGVRTKAPMVNASGIAEYLCSKHLVMAHAKAWHVYQNDFKPIQGGQCGITISTNWHGAATDSEEDEMAAEIHRQAEWGQYAHPIFSETGDFPKEWKERVAAKSAAQGYARSRLPEFTQEEIEFVRGTADFYGMNHYTGRYVRPSKSKDFPVPSRADDMEIDSIELDEWPQAASPWLKLFPGSIYFSMMHIKEKYNNPIIYITENGWSTYGGLADDDGVAYYRSVLNSVLDALDDGVRVKGYMAWSLMDNFEWMEGYTEKFGLYEVDFEDPDRKRTPRKSAFVYKEIIRSRVIDESYEPSSTIMTIDPGH